MSTEISLATSLDFCVVKEDRLFDTCLLDVPELLGPNDNVTFVVPPATNVTFLWDVVTGADYYILQVSESQDFRGATTYGVRVEDTTLVVPFLDFVGDIPIGYSTYYWRLFAYSDAVDNGPICSSPSSEIRQFTFEQDEDNAGDDGNETRCQEYNIRKFRVASPSEAKDDNTVSWSEPLDSEADGEYPDVKLKVDYSVKTDGDYSITRGFRIVDFGPFSETDFVIENAAGTSKSATIIPSNDSSTIKQSGTIKVEFFIDVLSEDDSISDNKLTCSRALLINYTFIDQSSSSSSQSISESSDSSFSISSLSVSSSSSQSSSSSSGACVPFNGQCVICDGKVIDFRNGVAYECTELSGI